jgi:hypothetical protein
MDKFARTQLGIHERSDDELQSAVSRFQAKWDMKAKRFGIE